jgi:hypothetical protein
MPVTEELESFFLFLDVESEINIEELPKNTYKNSSTLNLNVRMRERNREEN